MKTSMGKRLGSLLLTLVFLLGMLPAMEQNAKAAITDWAELQAALDAGGTVTLTQDITATGSDSPLAITSGVTATLDLNGKTLTANNTMAASASIGSSKMAILVQSGGALTVRDTGTGGKINGNGATYGVYLNDGTATACPSFTLEGGTISGCSAYGVKIMGGRDSSYQPTFTMTGGTISGNTRGGVSTSAAAYSIFNMSGGTITGNGGAAGSSTNNYGGVFISGGTFTMSGGSITANGGTYGGVCLHADIGTCVLNMSGGSITNNTGSTGGGVYVNGGTFTMSGGTIAGNSAVNGGGVYVTGANGKFIMNGGTINGNKSRVNGGGVYVGGGTFQLSGGVTIQSNVGNCTESSNTLSGGMANNVYLAADKIIAVANSLSSTAGTIGVTAADPAANRVIAQGDNYYMTQTDGGKFTCENQAFGASYGENKVMLSPLSFGISYELDGGALASGVTNPSSYDVTSAAITLNNPTKTGYDFAGWTGTGLTGAATDVTIPTGSTGARSYTATWTIKQYTITFVTGDGGTAITPITQDYNTAVTAPADPTREGYHFDGWDMAIPETMPAENLTITARWSGVSWSLSDGVLTITGSGAMPDYTKGAAPWFARRAEIQSVVFRSTAAPITHIGNYAFYACGAIRSVSVDSVGMSVGDYAFAYCAALQSVVNADGGGARFGDVGKRAFYACFSLSTANRPAVQGAQGDGAFDLCGLN